MTRRSLLTALALLAGSITGLAAAAPAGKAKPLQVTYYYLPG